MDKCKEILDDAKWLSEQDPYLVAPTRLWRMIVRLLEYVDELQEDNKRLAEGKRGEQA